jgi:hypothetical protein
LCCAERAAAAGLERESVFGRGGGSKKENAKKTHIVGQAELLEVPQALELGRVDDRHAGRLQIKVACCCFCCCFRVRRLARRASERTSETSERRANQRAARTRQTRTISLPWIGSLNVLQVRRRYGLSSSIAHDWLAKARGRENFVSSAPKEERERANRLMMMMTMIGCGKSSQRWEGRCGDYMESGK